MEPPARAAVRRVSARSRWAGNDRDLGFGIWDSDFGSDSDSDSGSPAPATAAPDTSCQKAGIKALQGAGLLDNVARAGLPINDAVGLGVTVRPGADLTGEPGQAPAGFIVGAERAIDQGRLGGAFGPDAVAVVVEVEAIADGVVRLDLRNGASPRGRRVF